MTNSINYLTTRANFVQISDNIPVTKQRKAEKFDPDDVFTAFSDADHAGNPDNAKSTGGYALLIGGGAVSWSSRLQPLIALSTTEAEYISATAAGQEC